jgi:hypothetical protein
MSCGGEGSRNRRATRPASWTSPARGPRCWVLHGAGGGERGEIELARLPPGAEIAKDVTATVRRLSGRRPRSGRPATSRPASCRLSATSYEPAPSVEAGAEGGGREGRARAPSVCTARSRGCTPVFRYGRGRCPRLLVVISEVPPHSHRTATPIENDRRSKHLRTHT